MSLIEQIRGRALCPVLKSNVREISIMKQCSFNCSRHLLLSVSDALLLSQ